jgi:hypothetical protein
MDDVQAGESRRLGAWRRRAWRGTRGQTTTEYLMIAGIFTVITIILLSSMYPNWRRTMQEVANCVINRELCK